MENKEHYTIEDVIEVLYSTKSIIEMELAGIRTDINILLNPEVTEASESITENKDLLILLLKILDKAFNLYILTKTFIDVIIVDFKGAYSILNLMNKLLNDLIKLTFELDKYEEIAEVPEAVELKNVVNLEDCLNKLVICYDILNK